MPYSGDLERHHYYKEAPDKILLQFKVNIVSFVLQLLTVEMKRLPAYFINLLLACIVHALFKHLASFYLTRPWVLVRVLLCVFIRVCPLILFVCTGHSLRGGQGHVGQPSVRVGEVSALVLRQLRLERENR